MEEKIKLQRKQSLVTILTDIIMIVVSFIMMIDSVIGEKSTILVKQNLANVFSNYNKKPIEEIVQATWQCPMDFEPLYEGKYFGSYQGCYENSTHHYYKGSCRDNHKKGRDLPEIKNFPQKIWRNSLICIKRYNRNFKIIDQKFNKSCADGLKYCGKVDIYGNYMCVANTDPCPITSIIISRESFGNYYRWFQLDDKLRFSFTNNSVESEIIPIDFKMSLDAPCLMVDHISNITPAFDLVYSSMRAKFGCVPEGFTLAQLQKYDPNITTIDLRDKRFTLLDSMNYFQYLKQNDILDDVTEVYKEYFDRYNYKTANISIFKRGYIGQNFTCISKQNYDILEDELKDSKALQFQMLLMDLLNITVICLFISFLSLVKSKQRFDVMHISMSYLKLILAGAFIFFDFKVIFECYAKSDMLVDLINYSSLNGCFEQSTIFALEVYNIQKNILQTKKYNQFLFWGSVIYASAVFVQFVHLTIKTYEKFKNSKKMTNDARAALKQHLSDDK